MAMFRWAEHVDGDHVQRVRDAFDALAAEVDGVRHHAHGSDVGVSEGAYDFHVVADFDDIAGWRAYRDHPAHVLLMEELINGHVSQQATGQFQAPGRGAAPGTPRTSFVGGPDDPSSEESDDELLARARRAAMAEMEQLLAEPDDPV